MTVIDSSIVTFIQEGESWTNTIKVIAAALTIVGTVLTVGRWLWKKLVLQRGLSSFADHKLKLAEKNRRDPGLHRFLRWKYSRDDVEILERCGQVYPVAVFRAPKSQWAKVNSVIGDYNPGEQDPKELLTTDRTFRKIIGLSLMSTSRKKRARSLYDHSNYSMSRIISTKSKLTVDCCRGSYFGLIDTCYSLEWELLKKWRPMPSEEEANLENRYKAFDKNLKLRNRLNGRVIDPVRYGTHRVAGLAVSGLIAYRGVDGKVRLLVKTRSTRGVAIYSGWHHVVPAGQMEPVSDPVAEIQNEDRGGVKFNFFREYLEELFSKEDPTGPKGPGRSSGSEMSPLDSTYLDSRLRLLQDLLKSGRAKLLLTGVTMNLLCLQPEICMLLYIDSTDWIAAHMSDDATAPHMKIRLNHEYAPPQDPGAEVTEQQIGEIQYSESDEIMMNSFGTLASSRFVPNGAAAFWLGIDALREVLNQQEIARISVASAKRRA
jgi:hypothetical protein